VPRWNIAPTQIIPIVRSRPGRELRIVRQGEGGERELVPVRWGLIPAWAKDPAIGNRMINARAEDVVDKPASRSAFRTCRYIVPASGFYEWQRQGRGPRQSYLIQGRDGEPMALRAYGRAGRIGPRARWSRPARSSPARPTRSWPSCTTACR
jgi:putative SOS response-associated peptidase YedK